MANAAKNVLLAAKYDPEKDDPAGYWMSEKMDGVRAYFDAKTRTFYSRSGNVFYAPKFFTDALPNANLDGEIWCGRNGFQRCVGIVKTKKSTKQTDDMWKFCTYLVFDAPSLKKPFEERYEWLKKNIDPLAENSYAAVVGHELCKGKEHMLAELKKVLDMGGEGLMLREPKSAYVEGRNKTLLKVKVFHDEECRVLKHENGTGRLQHMMGKIHCELPNGVKFKIGTGFSDAQRKNPPKIGAVVTFKYQEISNSGVPRFPVFLRIREDVTWDEVKKSAAKSKPFSEEKKKSFHLKKSHTVLYTTVPSRDQSTSKKQVTDDDAIEPPLVEPGSESGDKAAGKPLCKYGKLCYQQNESHRATFYHESNEEAPVPAAAVKKGGKKNPAAEATKPACKFGSDCWRTAADHREKYTHEEPPKKAAKKGKGKQDDEEKEKEKEKEEEAIEDVLEFSGEEDVPKDALKRAATVAISVADVEEAAEAAAAAEPTRMVEISLAELTRLQELARKAEELQPKKKRSKN